VKARLAELQMDLHINRLRALSIASSLDAGHVPTVDATMSKIATTELRAKLADWAMTIAGMSGQLNRKDPRSPLAGDIELEYRCSPIQRFGGGTNEVMRDIVAQQKFLLPRSR
jgi:alkylation response protein AidB-like acyl-CoA dehydrogenase